MTLHPLMTPHPPNDDDDDDDGEALWVLLAAGPNCWRLWSYTTANTNTHLTNHSHTQIYKILLHTVQSTSKGYQYCKCHFLIISKICYENYSKAKQVTSAILSIQF